MDLSVIDDILKKTIISSIVLFLCAIFYSGVLDACGILIGAGWGCANFYLLKQFLIKILNKREKAKELKSFIFVVLIKFPCLYAIGFFIMRMHFFSILYIVAGFSLLFVVIFLFGLKLLAVNYLLKGKSDVN